MRRRIIKVAVLTLIVIVLIFLISILFNEVVYPMTYDEDYIEKIEEHPDWTCDEIGCIYETDDYKILTGGLFSSVIFQLKERTGFQHYYFDIRDNDLELFIQSYNTRMCFVTIIRTIHCDIREGLSLTLSEKAYIREMIGVVRRSIR